MCLGNSLTSGITLTGDQSYPGQLSVLLAGSSILHDSGIPAQTTQNMQAGIVAQAIAYYHPKVSLNVGVAWEGTNDLYFGATAAAAYAHLVTYCQSLRTIGFKAIILTILPRSDAGTPVNFETSRQSVNANLVANWATFADAIYDCASDARIGNAGDENNLTYYLNDHVHLNATGYAIIATGVQAAISEL